MIDPIAVQFGPFTIYWYAIIIMVGVVIGVYLTIREGEKKGITSDDVIDFMLIAFPLSILGARVYYVAFQWDYYSKHLEEIIAIWNGGIAIYGGLITGVICLLVYCYRHFIPPIRFLDIFAPGVMLAQSIGRWGNFVNQEAYGKAVKNLPVLPTFIRQQMFIDGSYRIPTFLYESLWNLLGFCLIVFLRSKPKWLKEGEVILFYLIWYGSGRFVIEGMRTDSLMLGGLRVSQWLSAVLVGVGICSLLYRRQKDIPYYKMK